MGGEGKKNLPRKGEDQAYVPQENTQPEREVKNPAAACAKTGIIVAYERRDSGSTAEKECLGFRGIFGKYATVESVFGNVSSGIIVSVLSGRFATWLSSVPPT